MAKPRLPIHRQLLTQLALTIVAAFVLAPLWGLLRLALDGSLHGAPTEFRLWPLKPTLEVFTQVWKTPSQSLSFLGLLRNSLIIAGGAAAASIILGASSAYAYARFRFRGQHSSLFAILVGAFLPLVALMTPLYLLLEILHLRSTMFGLIIVYTAFNLPFSIWNMRAAFQAVPKELEEAAFLDGAGLWQTFWRITLPNALPSIGVAALVAFLMGYSEFAIGWLFIERSGNATLAMALWGIRSLGAVPWSQLAALSLMMSLPIIIIFLILQRALFDRLTFGELKP
jgi:ABC-type glycerol-3-phosphate transport system permease component